MLWIVHTSLAASWTDEELQVLKDERKKYAQEEQDLDKETKIDLLRSFKEPIKEVQSMFIYKF